jgi:hypothetical protein
MDFINTSIITIAKRALLLATVLTVSACGGGSSESSSLPIVLDAPIAYVKRPLQYDDNGDLVNIDISDPIAFNPGGDLYLRDRAAASSEEINITSSFTGGMGDVKDVEFSYDGSKLVFAMRAPDIPNAQPEDQPKWDIWEYDIASASLSRVIESETLAQQHQDVAPHYLPDGQIVFASTRQRGNQITLLDEGKGIYPGLTDNRQQLALVLHRIDPDTGAISQLSYNQSHDFDPVVLDSGRVLFSRWDNAGGRNAVNLYSINPDGTDLQLVYGAHSHDTGSNNSIIQFLKARELDNGEVVSILAPFNRQTPGGMLTSIDINNFIDNSTPTWVNQGLTTTAQTNLVNTNIQTDGSPSPGGLYGAAYPLRDGTNRYLVSWTQCRLENTNGTIIPCTQDNLADTSNVEAPPLFGLYIYDAANNTQVPVTSPVENIMYTDMAAASPRTPPGYIQDKQAGAGLTQAYIDENVGVLNIKSVYDMDGVDSTPAGIDVMADPALTPPANRPARFLRIVKAVSIPDDTFLDLDNDAYGVSTAQGMREIIGYAPIEPDGSVKVKVPANVPLAISILDENGKRISQRHQNWIQVQKGETLTCNGCHNHASGQPHGRPDGPPAVNTGPQLNGYIFPNTDPALWADMGETMAEARTRHDPAAMTPSVDIVFDDVWTDNDPMGANLPKAASFAYRYADLTTASAPVSSGCQTTWRNIDISPVCRTIINYEAHIHPLWSLDRGANTCINCHTTAGGTQVPLGNTQLDLTDGIDPTTNRETAYQELLAADNQQVLNAGTLEDQLIQDPDEPFLLDTDGNQILDTDGNPIPNMIPVQIGPAMSANGAIASATFFNVFETGSHVGYLTEAELKLIAEWLDIGAQYYNNPFSADPARFVN